MDRAYRFSVTDTGAAGAGIINGGVYLHEAGRVNTSDCGTGRITDWRRLYDMGGSTSVHSSGSEGTTPTRSASENRKPGVLWLPRCLAWVNQRPNPTSTDGISGPRTADFNLSLMWPKRFAAISAESSAGSSPASTMESSKASTVSSRLQKPKPAVIDPTATSPPSSTSSPANST